MISKMKNGIREILTERCDTWYRMELEEKTCSYDAWIRKRENSELEEHKEYLKKISGEIFEKEYFIFTFQKKNISFMAEVEIEKIFTEYPEVQVLYSDEDEMNHEENVRMNPWFKPDYSPETLMSYFYFGGFVAVRKSAAVKVFKELAQYQGHVVELEESDRKQLYELILRICMPLNRNQIYHSNKILYTSHAISYWGWEDEYNEIKQEAWKLREKEKITGVSIIIPSKDNPEVLRRCLVSVLQYTSDIPYEIILIDNGSNVKNRVKIETMRQGMNFNYIYHPMEFNFSAMCNMGAKAAKEKLLLF